MTTSSERLGAGRYIATRETPLEATTTAHELQTADGAKVSGLLRTVPGARTVICLMHPRTDGTHHPVIPDLLGAGYAVWTQNPRSPNNDINLIHEEALLDVAAGMVFLRDRSFERIITLGHSGGGTLYAFYHQQASLAPEQRLTRTPAGRAIGLSTADMPRPDAAIFLAPHPGQGALLMRLIDPSVVDESDPLSADPALDPFSPVNGFAEPPASAHYDPEFVARYRAAQRDRVARLDAVARERVAQAADGRQRFKGTGDRAYRLQSLVPRILTVYRTDADLRSMDLTLDPNDRPYGSLFGRRPDLTNYGLVGFARFCTPDAWLSTWSALSTNADFIRCAPAITSPTLFVELTGDQACFPADAQAMVQAIGADNKTHVRVPGTHFGGPLRAGEPSGAELAAAEIVRWLATLS
jgi:hypothetical protein